MKRTLLLLTLLIVGFASCKKDDDDDDNLPQKASYNIIGITDRTMQKPPYGTTQPVQFNLNLVYENSAQERVVLSLEGAPDGLKHKFGAKAGVPTFSTYLQLLDSGVAAGEYTMRLVATGDASGRRSFDFNLSVLAAEDCSGEIIGNNYISQGGCQSSATFTQNVTAVAGEPSKVIFSNIDNSGAAVYGYVICGSGQLVIPAQTVNGASFQGSGNFGMSGGARYVYLNFSKIIGTTQYNCSVQLRQ